MKHRRLNWRAPLVLAAAVLGVGRLAARAGAVSAVLANGATIALPATTEATEPDLAGPVIHGAVIPFQVKNAANTTVLCEVQLQTGSSGRPPTTTCISITGVSGRRAGCGSRDAS